MFDYYAEASLDSSLRIGYLSMCFLKFVCFFVRLFVFGATAPSGPGPPHSRRF